MPARPRGRWFVRCPNGRGLCRGLHLFYRILEHLSVRGDNTMKARRVLAGGIIFTHLIMVSNAYSYGRQTHQAVASFFWCVLMALRSRSARSNRVNLNLSSKTPPVRFRMSRKSMEMKMQLDQTTSHGVLLSGIQMLVSLFIPVSSGGCTLKTQKTREPALVKKAGSLVKTC